MQSLVCVLEFIVVELCIVNFIRNSWVGFEMSLVQTLHIEFEESWLILIDLAQGTYFAFLWVIYSFACCKAVRIGAAIINMKLDETSHLTFMLYINGEVADFVGNEVYFILDRFFLLKWMLSDPDK